MRKTISILILFITSVTFAWSQSDYSKLINKEKFDNAEKKITKALSKKPDDISLNFFMAVLHIQKKYHAYNPDSSYYYLLKSKSLYEAMYDERVLKDLNKIPIDGTIFNNYNDTICKNAFNIALKENSIPSYEKFINYYKTAPIQYKQQATKNRDIGAFKLSSETNTIDSYLEFISKYSNAEQVNQAWERIHEIAYAAAEKENTSFSFNKFASQYPKSKQYPKAFKLFEEKQFFENIRANDYNSFKSFIEKYPNNSWIETAEDSIISIALRNENIELLKYCVETFSGSSRNKALLYYHDYYINDGESTTIDSFYEKYDDNIFNLVKSRDYEIAYLGNSLLLEYPYSPSKFSAYNEYIQMAAPKEKAFVALQRMISPDIIKKDWQSAFNTVKNYQVYFGENNKKILHLLSILESKFDNTIKVNSVGSEVNTETGGEYSATVSADDKLMYFCGRHRPDNIGGEDIFVSKKVNGKWTKPKIINDLSTSYSNDAPECVSNDGTTMILFKSGKLYYSEKYSLGWNYAIKFPEEINAGDWQADAVISSDSKAILFASTKEGGYNSNTANSSTLTYHGDRQYLSDIYVSLLNENNEWSKPINLGDIINTPYTDRMPFLHPDMKTLYFSSDGHGGLGKLDVYKSTRLADSCWTCWSEPINMGKEINTEESDWGYKISTDGEKAYFSKKNSISEEDDIYWLNLPNSLKPDLVATVSGKLMDKNNQPVSAEIRWEDLSTGKNVGQSKSDPNDGSFFIVLPLGKIYGYYVDKDEYFPISNSIDLRTNNKPVRIEEDIDLITLKQMIEDGTAVPVNNLFFNFAASSLLPYSIPELKRVSAIIKVNKLKVEISGHTDNIGELEKNQTLSEQRAIAVKDFLVAEGCSAENLITIGYGETKPIASNESEAGRTKNRRVELKFVK